MSKNQNVYTQIKDILTSLKSELDKVANRDASVSENEKEFIAQVEKRIPEIRAELDHVFQDDNVTEEEKLELYEHLGKLMNDAVAYSRIDDKIDEEEIFLITKLKNQLSSIIKALKDTGKKN